MQEASHGWYESLADCVTVVTSPSLTKSAVSRTFSSTLQHRLGVERHFALVEICQANLGLASKDLAPQIVFVTLAADFFQNHCKQVVVGIAVALTGTPGANPQL